MSLETIVKNMLAANEPESNIAKVIKHYKSSLSPLKNIEQVEDTVETEEVDCGDPNLTYDPVQEKCVPIKKERITSTFVTDDDGNARIVGKKMREDISKPYAGLKVGIKYDPITGKEVLEEVPLEEVVVTGEKPEVEKLTPEQEAYITEDWFEENKLDGTSETDVNKQQQNFFKNLYSDPRIKKIAKDVQTQNEPYLKQHSIDTMDRTGLTSAKQTILNQNQNHFARKLEEFLKQAGIPYGTNEQGQYGPVDDGSPGLQERFKAAYNKYQKYINNFINAEIQAKHPEELKAYNDEMQKFTNDRFQENLQNNKRYQDIVKQYNDAYNKNIGPQLKNAYDRETELTRKAINSSMKYSAIVPGVGGIPGMIASLAPEFSEDYVVPQVAAIGNMLLNTTGGLIDFAEMGINAVDAAFLATIGEEEDFSTAFSKLSKQNNIDVSSIYDAADFLGQAKVRYFNNKGEQMQITDLIKEGNYSGAANLAINEAVGTAPSIAATIYAPWLAPILLGASTTGQEFARGLKNPELVDKNVLTLAGASLLKGGIEWGSEFAAGKFFRTLKNYGKAARANGVSREKIASDINKTLQEGITGFKYRLLGGGRKTLEGMVVEGGTEGVTGFGQGLTDAVILDDEKAFKNLWKNTVNQAIIGSVAGGGTTAGAVSLNVFQSKASLKKARLNAYKYLGGPGMQLEFDLLDQQIFELEDILKKGQDKKGRFINKKNVQAEINKLKNQRKAKEDYITDKFENQMTPEELKSWGQTMDRINDLESKIDNPKFTRDEQDAAINEIKELREEQKEAFKPIPSDVSVDEKGIVTYSPDADKTISQMLKRKLSKDAKKSLDQIKDDADVIVINDSQREKYGMQENESGKIVKTKDGRFKIALNEDAMIRVKDGATTINHELNHLVFVRDLVNNDKNAIPLIENFRSFIKENLPGVNERIESRMKKNYKNASKDDVRANLEFVAIFTDIAGKEKLGIPKVPESAFGELASGINNWLKSKGFKKIKLNTGEDVFNWIQEFNKNIKKGKYKDALRKIDSDNVTDGGVSEAFITGEFPSLSSKSDVIEDINFEEGSINERFQEFSHDGKNNNAPQEFQTEAAITYEPLAAAVIDRISKVGIGKAGTEQQNNFITDALEDSTLKQQLIDDLVYGTERNPASSLVGLAKTFNPAVGSFGGYAKSQLANRAIRVLQERVGGQVTEGATSTDTAESRQLEDTAGQSVQSKQSLREAFKNTTLGEALNKKLGKVAESAPKGIEQTIEKKGKDLTKLPTKRKAEAVDTAKKQYSSKYLYTDVANLFGKKQQFIDNVNKYYPAVIDAWMNNVNWSKGMGISTGFNIESKPTQQETVDYLTGNDLVVGTINKKGDPLTKKGKTDAIGARKRKFLESIATQLVNENIADNKIAQSDFIKKHGVGLLSTSNTLKGIKKENANIYNDIAAALLKMDDAYINNYVTPKGKLIRFKPLLTSLGIDEILNNTYTEKKAERYFNNLVNELNEIQKNIPAKNREEYIKGKDFNLVDRNTGKKIPYTFANFLRAKISQTADIQNLKDIAAGYGYNLELNYNDKESVERYRKEFGEALLSDPKINKSFALNILLPTFTAPSKIGGGAIGVNIDGDIVETGKKAGTNRQGIFGGEVGAVADFKNLINNLDWDAPIFDSKGKEVKRSTKQYTRPQGGIYSLLEKPLNNKNGERALPFIAYKDPVLGVQAGLQYQQYLKDFVESIKNSNIGVDTKAILVQAMKANPSGLIRMAAIPDFIPSFVIKKDSQGNISIDLSKVKGEWRLEHMDPANIMTAATFDYLLNPKASKKEYYKRLDSYKSAQIPKLYDDAVNVNYQNFRAPYSNNALGGYFNPELPIFKNLPLTQISTGIEYTWDDFVNGNGQQTYLKNENSKKNLEDKNIESGGLYSQSKLDPIYQELQLIEEYESNFNITPSTKARREELQNQLKEREKINIGLSSSSESTLSREFNEMLERTKGIKAEAVYSEARAIKLGATKGWQAFVPYSNEDYMGLVYPTLGKGKQGDADLKWWTDNVMDPYNQGIQDYETAKQAAMQEWKQLKGKIKNTPANLKRKAVRGFTNEEAVRIYLWDKQGMIPDNLAKKDITELRKHVNKNPELKAFAHELQNIGSNGYPEPTNNWLSGNITTDLINEVNTVTRREFLKPWRQSIDLIYTKDNVNKLRATFGDRYVEALDDVLYRMDTGRNRPTGANRVTNMWLNWLNNSVGTTMFFNQRSSLLQTISAINFLNWSDNNPIMAAKAFADQPQFWKDFADLFNSDFLKQRRSGLQIDISADEIASTAATSKNKVRAALNELLKVGFISTQIADSFAIAIGGASFYRNRLNKYKKEGLSEKEAQEKAFFDFRNIAIESQQSSDPSRISMQQASQLGRIILSYANTPVQYARLIKKAASDLKNGRGDAKTNVSKILYYGAIQNIIFTALQSALFGIMFDEEDEEVGEKEAQFKQERKEGAPLRIINGIADTLLRGSGVGGAFVAMLKNVLLEIDRQRKKSRPDFTYAANKIFSFSPVTDTKFRKALSAARKFTYKQELQKMYDRGVAIDNPALLAAGELASAFVNIPADRVVKKLNNLKTATEEETKAWQSIALVWGFGEWELGIQARKTDEARAKAKKEKAKKKELKKDIKKLQKEVNKEKKSPVKDTGGRVLGRANKDGSIEVAKGLSPKKKAEVIRHEKLHQKEMQNGSNSFTSGGKLDYNDNFVFYGKKKYARKNGKIKDGNKWKVEGDHSLPWEVFAHKND